MSKASPYPLIGYCLHNCHHFSVLCAIHSPFNFCHSQALLATSHVLTNYPCTSICIHFQLGESVLTVYTNSILYEFTHHVSGNPFMHSHTITVPVTTMTIPTPIHPILTCLHPSQVIRIIPEHPMPLPNPLAPS